jgi:hypothetical protein
MQKRPLWKSSRSLGGSSSSEEQGVLARNPQARKPVLKATNSGQDAANAEKGRNGGRKAGRREKGKERLWTASASVDPVKEKANAEKEGRSSFLQPLCFPSFLL